MLDGFWKPEEGVTFPPPPSIIEWGVVPVDLWSCISLDPGGTTGWCVISIYTVAMKSGEYRILDNIHQWALGEITGSIGHQIDKLVDLVDAWDSAEVVCEDFILRSPVMSRELLDPIRITEPLKWWLERGGRRAYDQQWVEEDWSPRTLALQQPSLAMTTITDERLREAGMYPATVGKPHARDALRHALTYARRRKSELERESIAA